MLGRGEAEGISSLSAVRDKEHLYEQGHGIAHEEVHCTAMLSETVLRQSEVSVI